MSDVILPKNLPSQNVRIALSDEYTPGVVTEHEAAMISEAMRETVEARTFSTVTLYQDLGQLSIMEKEAFAKLRMLSDPDNPICAIEPPRIGTKAQQGCVTQKQETNAADNEENLAALKRDLKSLIAFDKMDEKLSSGYCQTVWVTAGGEVLQRRPGQSATVDPQAQPHACALSHEHPIEIASVTPR